MDTSPTPSEAAANLASGLADVMEIMAPMFETAKGMRAAMEAEGWSPTVAEQTAATWLNATIARAVAG